MFASEFYTKILRDYQADGNEGRQEGLESLKNIEILAPFTLSLNLSNNKLKRVEELKGFANLLELNLACNFLDSIDCLKSLHNLQLLDLRGNCLSDLSGLNAIKEMPGLKSIHLEGNPLCDKFPDYIDHLYQWQTSLRAIDGHDCPSKTLACSRSSLAENDLVTPHQIESMQRQLAALTSSYEIQEQLLGERGREGVQRVRGFLLNHLMQSNAQSPSSFETIKSSYDAVNRDFPFHRLLTHWRSAAMQSAVQTTLLQRRVRELFEDKKKTEQLQQKHRQDSEARLLSLEKRITVQQERLGLLEHEKAELIEQLKQHYSANLQMMKKYVAYRDSYAHFFSFLKNYHSKVSEEQLSFNALRLGKVEQLQQLEHRLCSMKQQVQTLAEWLQFKELQVRDDRAMLDLEKRLLHYQVSQPEQQQQSEEPLPLSDLNIPPETESFLKTIFLHLDWKESGLVQVEHLLKAIFLSSEREESPRSLSSVGNLLRSSLGSDRNSLFGHFLDNLQQLSPDRDLSWGELLLQFIPTSPTQPQKRQRELQQEELRQLSQNGLVEAVDFSVLPLLLTPRPATSDLASLQDQCSSLLAASSSLSASDRRDGELERLRAERRLLSRQLQQSSRRTTRTAELVRAFYDSRLQLADQRERKAEQERAELQQEVSRLRQRLEEMTQLQQQSQRLFEESQERADLTIKDLQQQVQSQQDSHKETFEQRSKEQSRLELENMNLLAQCKKKDTQFALLEKQLDRKTKDLEKSEKERARMQEKLESDLQRLSEQHAEEVLALTQKIVALEEERYRLLKQREEEGKNERQDLPSRQGDEDTEQAAVTSISSALPLENSRLTVQSLQQVEQRIALLLNSVIK